MAKVKFTRNKEIVIENNVIGRYWGNRGYLKGEAVADFSYKFTYFGQTVEGGEHCSYVSDVKDAIRDDIALLETGFSEYQKDEEISHFSLSYEDAEADDSRDWDIVEVTTGSLTSIVEYLYKSVPTDLWYKYILTEHYGTIGTVFEAEIEVQRLTYWLEDFYI